MFCTSILKRTQWFDPPIIPRKTTSRKLHHSRAEHLIKALHESPRKAVNPNLIKRARAFLKKQTINRPSQVETLKKELLAAKLKICADLFDSNPGFEQFACKHHLDRYLLHYDHALKIEGNIILLRSGDSYKKWSEVQKEFDIDYGHRSSPSLEWVYGPQGIQHKDMYNWETLEPYKWDNPSLWGNQYIFEFCVTCSESPQVVGDHSWLRLKTPAGAIYSVGLYRPQKRSWKDTLFFPLRIKKGHLMQPDVSEFWPCEIRSVEIAITEEEFLAMKKKIEKDKKNDDLVFQLFGENCTLYTASIGKIAGIEFDTSISFPLLWAPRKILPFVEKTLPKIPKIIRNIISTIMAVVLNTVQLILGAGIVDKEAKNASPYIKSLREFFDPSKYYLHHPHTFGTRVREFVLAWREQESTKCSSEQERKKIRFAVPKMKTQVQPRETLGQTI